MKEFNVLSSQYVYITSLNKASYDAIYDFTIDIPPGMVQCEQEQFLAISVSRFNITKNWYYVNSQNNYIKIINNTAFPFRTMDFYLSEGNYTFKKLALQLEIELKTFLNMNDVYIRWDSNRNKYIFTLPPGIGFDFTSSNSMWYILGFNKNFTFVSSGLSDNIISQNILNIYLTQCIDLHCENVTPDKNVSAIENSTNNSCVPSSCIMSLSNNFPPYETLDFENQDSKFRLIIKEKSLNKLRLTIRNENNTLLTFITDYNTVLRIDTISFDTSRSDKKIKTLESIEDYLRLNFVSNNLNSV